MKLKITLLLLLGFSISLLGQETPPPYWQADQELERRITEEMKESQQAQSNGLKDLKTEVEQLRQETQSHLDWKWVAGFLGIATLAGSITFFSYLGRVKAKMNEKVVRMMKEAQKQWSTEKESVLSLSSENLKQMMEELELKAPELMLSGILKASEKSKAQLANVLNQYDYETRILPAKPLLVLVHNPEDEKEAHQLLEKTLGFTQVKVQYCTDSQQPDYTEFHLYHLVVIWEFRVSFPIELVEPLLQRARETYNQEAGQVPITFLIFIKGHSALLNNHRDVAHAANSPFALYARIAETHRYTDVIRRTTSPRIQNQ